MMSGAELLLSLVAVLYLVECIAVVRSDEVLFERVGGRWLERSAAVQLRGIDAGLVLTNPFSFHATHLIASAGAEAVAGIGSLRVTLRDAEDVLAPLRADCAALALFAFVAAPGLVFLAGISAAWMPILLCWLLLVSCTAQDLLRARRVLGAGADGGWSAVITIVISPAAAMRAHRLFARALVGRRHPLLVAKEICDGEELRRIAAAALRNRSTEPDVVALVSSVVAEPSRLIRPPDDRDPAARTWCPLCLGQYSLESGRCADCEDTTLIRFAEG